MTAATPKTHESYLLPPSVVSKLDLARLVHEVEQVDNELTTAAVRAKAGSPAQPHIVISQELTDLLQLNSLSLTADGRERSTLLAQLRALKDSAPVIHMTFAVTADRASLSQLAQWFRKSVHPQAVLSVGLQPALVAGVYLRTSNRVFDLSLRGQLAGKREQLVKELETYRAGR